MLDNLSDGQLLFLGLGTFAMGYFIVSKLFDFFKKGSAWEEKEDDGKTMRKKQQEEWKNFQEEEKRRRQSEH